MNLKTIKNIDFIWMLIAGLITLLPFVNIQLGITGLNRYVIATISILILIWNKVFIIRNRNGHFLIIYALLLIIPAIIHFDINYIIFLFTDIILPIYIGFSISIKNRRYMQKLIILLLDSGTILAIMGIFEAFTGINLIDQIYGLETVRFAANDYRMGIARAYTSFATSINFAVYLNMLQILCLYVITLRKKRRYWGIYVILFLASILTISRGPIVFNLLIQTYILIKLEYIKKKHIPWLILCGSVIGCILLMQTELMEVLGAAIGSIVNSNKYRRQAELLGFGGAGQRIKLFSWVYYAVRDQILLGNGYNATFAVKVDRWGHIKTSIENYYLANFFCYGIMAVVAMTVFYINLFHKFKPISIFAINMRDKYDFSFYGFTVLILCFLTLWTVSFQDEGRFFFIIVGIALADKQRRHILVNRAINIRKVCGRNKSGKRV